MHKEDLQRTQEEGLPCLPPLKPREAAAHVQQAFTKCCSVAEKQFAQDGNDAVPEVGGRK